MRDVDARRVAASWASGGDDLQVLATSGAITDSVGFMVDGIIMDFDNLPYETSERTQREASELREYITEKGERGPVEGWANLNWDPEDEDPS